MLYFYLKLMIFLVFFTFEPSLNFYSIFDFFFFFFSHLSDTCGIFAVSFFLSFSEVTLFFVVKSFWSEVISW